MDRSRVVQFGADHPVLVDAVLAAAIGGTTLRLAVHDYPAGARPFDAVAILLTVGSVLPLLVRRRAPAAAVLASSLAVGVYQVLDYWPALNQIGPGVALYTLAARRPWPWPLLGVAAVAPVMLYSNLLSWNGGPADITVQTVMWLVALVAVGTGRRHLTERTARLAEATENLRREQHDRERRAVNEERMRIARELHDVVAHHMAVISVHTGLAEYLLDDDPDRARTSLTTASRTAHDALDEMRRLLTVLRVEPRRSDPTGARPGSDDELDDDDAAAGYRPAPVLADLPALVDRLRGAGMTVAVRSTGEPAPLPPGVELCAYRVIQESLTNVVRHGSSAPTTVTIGHDAQELVVRIEDDGDGRPAPIGPPVVGHGLIGMRERARLYGGTVVAGPRHPSGYGVELRLPVHPADDALGELAAARS